MDTHTCVCTHTQACTHARTSEPLSLFSTLPPFRLSIHLSRSRSPLSPLYFLSHQVKPRNDPFNEKWTTKSPYILCPDVCMCMCKRVCVCVCVHVRLNHHHYHHTSFLHKKKRDGGLGGRKGRVKKIKERREKRIPRGRTRKREEKEERRGAGGFFNYLSSFFLSHFSNIMP